MSAINQSTEIYVPIVKFSDCVLVSKVIGNDLLTLPLIIILVGVSSTHVMHHPHFQAPPPSKPPPEKNTYTSAGRLETNNKLLVFCLGRFAQS